MFCYFLSTAMKRDVINDDMYLIIKSQNEKELQEKINKV